jgi:hypothetical protein
MTRVPLNDETSRTPLRAVDDARVTELLTAGERSASGFVRLGLMVTTVFDCLTATEEPVLEDTEGS